MNHSLYSKWIIKFLGSLVQLPINTGVSTILQTLSRYIDYLRINNLHNQEFREKLSKSDPLLANLEWALNTTVKERKYQRLSVFSGPNEESNLVSRISNVVYQLPFNDAIDFLGELAGAGF